MYLNLDLLYNISNYPDFLYWKKNQDHLFIEKSVYLIKNQKMVHYFEVQNCCYMVKYVDLITNKIDFMGEILPYDTQCHLRIFDFSNENKTTPFKIPQEIQKFLKSNTRINKN